MKKTPKKKRDQPKNHGLNYKGKRSKLKTALLLTGGGSRSAFQAGALKVILDKIVPDVIIGNSVGAINAAYIALDYPTEKLENEWHDFHNQRAFRLLRKAAANLLILNARIFRMKQKRWLKSVLDNKTFADCKIPLYIPVTRYSDGKAVYMHKGSLVDAIMATSALIPLFNPYKINGVKYVDGGFSDFCGIDQALKLKCKQLIVIDCNYYGREKGNRDLTTMSTRAIELVFTHFLKRELKSCKNQHVIKIAFEKDPEKSIIDFSHTPQFIKMGEKAARKFLNKIKI